MCRAARRAGRAHGAGAAATRVALARRVSATAVRREGRPRASARRQALGAATAGRAADVAGPVIQDAADATVEYAGKAADAAGPVLRDAAEADADGADAPALALRKLALDDFRAAQKFVRPTRGRFAAPGAVGAGVREND